MNISASVVIARGADDAVRERAPPVRDRDEVQLIMSTPTSDVWNTSTHVSERVGKNPV
jgi:hypothetical protein